MEEGRKGALLEEHLQSSGNSNLLKFMMGYNDNVDSTNLNKLKKLKLNGKYAPFTDISFEKNNWLLTLIGLFSVPKKSAKEIIDGMSTKRKKEFYFDYYNINNIEFFEYGYKNSISIEYGIKNERLPFLKLLRKTFKIFEKLDEKQSPIIEGKSIKRKKELTDSPKPKKKNTELKRIRNELGTLKVYVEDFIPKLKDIIDNMHDIFNDELNSEILGPLLENEIFLSVFNNHFELLQTRLFELINYSKIRTETKFTPKNTPTTEVSMDTLYMIYDHNQIKLIKRFDLTKASQKIQDELLEPVIFDLSHMNEIFDEYLFGYDKTFIEYLISFDKLGWIQFIFKMQTKFLIK